MVDALLEMRHEEETLEGPVLEGQTKKERIMKVIHTQPPT